MSRVTVSAWGSPDYITWIHEIRFDDGICAANSDHLLVTKYSFLRCVHPFQELESLKEKMARSDRDLLLHFEDFDNIGNEDDAETIRLDKLVYAQDLRSCRCTRVLSAE